MKRKNFIVAHPFSEIGIIPAGGMGGPGPGGVLGPAVPVNPIGPGSPPANAAGNLAQQAANQLGQGLTQAIGTLLAPAQVALGVLLIVAGLLLATGQLQGATRTAARLGLTAATRGAIR